MKRCLTSLIIKKVKINEILTPCDETTQKGRENQLCQHPSEPPRDCRPSCPLIATAGETSRETSRVSQLTEV